MLRGGGGGGVVQNYDEFQIPTLSGEQKEVNYDSDKQTVSILTGRTSFLYDPKTFLSPYQIEGSLIWI